jgi:riboflavin kinase/FMN adenylyltransferase
MEVIRAPGELRVEGAELLSFTLGNFDGLHRGHQAVMAELVRTSRYRGGPSVAVTFDPHPLTVVHPERAPGLLSPTDEKLEAMAAVGVDVALVVDFTPDIASEDAVTFLSWLGVSRGSHLVLGYDFQMGRDRACDLTRLSELGAELGFGLDIVPPVEHDGLPISSSRVRASVSAGEVQDAAAMLGRPYALHGEVVAGEALGRDLGAPTANLRVLQEKLLPGDGVYFGTVTSLGDRPALLYVGTRPTLGEGERMAEVHVLDFDGDLYGSRLSVAVHRRLRGDERFDGIAELEERIREDVERAREIAGGASGI